MALDLLKRTAMAEERTMEKHLMSRRAVRGDVGIG
jgi:hypothetical protein